MNFVVVVVVVAGVVWKKRKEEEIVATNTDNVTLFLEHGACISSTYIPHMCMCDDFMV